MVPETPSEQRSEQSRPAVELWVRADMPAAARERLGTVRERLRELDRDDRIATLREHVWSGRAPVASDPATGQTVPDPAAVPDAAAAVRRFRDWANRHGHSLEPAFNARETGQLHGAVQEAMGLPMICVATYRDGEVDGVYPSTGDGHVLTVADALADLERRAPGDSAGVEVDGDEVDAALDAESGRESAGAAEATERDPEGTHGRPPEPSGEQ